MKNRLVSDYQLSQHDASRNWYIEANQFCIQLSQDFEISIDKVAGILSALSPGVNWPTNKRDAIYLIQAHSGMKVGLHRFSTYGRNVQKAAAIFNGKKDAFNPKTGAKTWNFFWNILDPSDPRYVTIDRHMVEFMTGEKYEGLTFKKYEQFANEVKEAADIVGVLPNVLQAVVWTNQRHRKIHGNQLRLWRN